MVNLNIETTAVLALNTSALGIKDNLQELSKAVAEAQKLGKHALFASELSVCGMECQDLFLNHGFIKKIVTLVDEFQQNLPEDFVVGLGLPRFLTASEQELVSCHFCEDLLANSYVVMTKHERILQTPGKLVKHLSRTDYAYRYFAPVKSLSPEQLIKNYVFTIEQKQVLVLFGDPDLFLGLQDYVKEHKEQFAYIVMPEAYLYEMGKPHQVEQLCLKVASDFDLPVIKVNNLGCEGGSFIYDGQCLFIENKQLVARNALFSFKNGDLVTVERSVVPALKEKDELLKAIALGLYNWQIKTHSKGYAISMSGGADSALCATLVTLSHVHALLELGSDLYISKLQALGISNIDYEAFSEAVKEAGGIFKKGPYDDSCDSKTIDDVINVLKQYVLPKVLVLVYQGSDYSGQVTLTAAKKMAECLGATFYEWTISSLVSKYVDLVNNVLDSKLDWEHDDIALQNIQARARLPGIWLMANHKGFLLIATSNLSEAAVGYCTMDGDTAGGLSPIAGIGKSHILKINREILHEGIGLNGYNQSFKVPAIKFIVAQAPTAELRPGGEQTDEKDLMPYPLLDQIRKMMVLDNLMPQEIEEELINNPDKYAKVTYDLGLDDAAIRRSVRRFVGLFQRNQWKRERFATSFHIEPDDASPKSFLRFPILSESLYE